LPIPEEDETGEDIDQDSSNRDESLNQNKEQGSIEPEKHSEPIDASSEQQNDQIQQVTESIANMNTEEPNSINVTSEPPSQNEDSQDQSKVEQPIPTPPATPVNVNTTDANVINEKGMLIMQAVLFPNCLAPQIFLKLSF
jgi:hypothetical protein